LDKEVHEMRGRMLMMAAGMKMGEQRAQQQMQAQANQQAVEQARQEGAAQAQAAAPAPAAGGMSDATIAQLKQLADLHTSGVLSDEEFAAAKKKLLG
jgi:membrane protease subunit (stomatin/prohibitin family)